MGSGKMRDSYSYKIDKNTLAASIFSAVPYGEIQEEGRTGGQTVYPRSGKVLSWIGRDGDRHFAKSVRLGPMTGRHNLRRSLLESMPQIKTALAGYFKGLHR